MKTIIVIVLLGFSVLSFFIALGLVAKESLTKSYSDLRTVVFIWLCSCILTILAYNLL